MHDRKFTTCSTLSSADESSVAISTHGATFTQGRLSSPQDIPSAITSPTILSTFRFAPCRVFPPCFRSSGVTSQSSAKRSIAALMTCALQRASLQVNQPDLHPPTSTTPRLCTAAVDAISFNYQRRFLVLAVKVCPELESYDVVLEPRLRRR